MSTALIPEGVRNITLTSYAGSLRARGFSPDEILKSLRETNQQQCDPPLPDIEVRNVAKSAAKWKPYPTRQGSQQRIVRIPHGCFDPRPEVCGFDPAAVVDADRTLGLWRNPRTLYGVLVGIFGPWGCHPALRTIGEALGMPHQHVARHVARLESAGLILVEAGDYRKADHKFAARCYHFRRHSLFAEHFTLNGLPVFNDLQGFCHHCNANAEFSDFSTGQNIETIGDDSRKADFSTGEGKTSHKNQQVTEILSHRGDVVPNTQQEPRSSADCVNEEKDNHIRVPESPSTIHRALSDTEKKIRREKNFPRFVTFRNRADIAPWDFETDPDSIYNVNAIALYVECAARCGGALIRHTNGVVKRYPCSCENAAEAMTA